MKELSIEEKAKAYDEALERASNLHKDAVEMENNMTTKTCEIIFPELKESEDEKIRNEMIFYFTEEILQCSIQEHSDKMRVFISWLKRQEVERTKLELKAGNSYFCYKSRWERADNETFKKGLIYKCNKDGVLDNFVIKNPEQHFIEIKDERIAWIEKQSEKKSLDNIAKEVIKDKDAAISFLKSTGIMNENGELADEYKIKQAEQKPADKVEPKFKAGDWITNGIDCTFQIHSIENNMYLRSDDYFIDIETADKKFRIWTIQDAKDGDVLFMDNGSANCIFIYKSSNNGIINKYASYNKFGFEGEHYLVLNDGYVIPTTKEQRDTLLKAMTDAGYTFDFEKKELKKIEQKPAIKLERDDNGEPVLTPFEAELFSMMSEAWQGYSFGEEVNIAKIVKEHSVELLKRANEQKPAWSEEDEVKINRIVACLENLNVADNDILLKDVEWLKSLKDRYTWKPTELQLECLSDAIDSYNKRGYSASVLSELLEQLKKLREE